MELTSLLFALGFSKRTNGDHHIFNIQPQGYQAKSYQVRQVRNVILKYQLKLDSEDENE
ncbi:MAG: hypothetical protein LBS86_06040 [Treponema sp.]|jgi:hypothetical protein|nr:hypothetical protein [Treponema sp.]